MEFSVVCAFLIACISSTYSYRYKAFFRDVDIFSPCENQPENVLDIHGLFDFSNFKTEFNEDQEIVVSGNLTTIWDIQPTDKIKMTGSLMRFDRGSWVSSQYSLSIPDICLVLHIKNDIWYEPWIKHVINADKIKNKCFNPGTKFVHETYPVQGILHTQESGLGGLYKSETKFEAFSSPYKLRPTSICFQMQAEFNAQ